MGNESSRSANSNQQRSSRRSSDSNASARQENKEPRIYFREIPSYSSQTSYNPSNIGYSQANIRASQPNEMNNNNFKLPPPVILPSKPSAVQNPTSMSKSVPAAQKNPSPAANVNVKMTSVSVTQNKSKNTAMDFDEIEKRINNLSLPSKESDVFNSRIKTKDVNEIRGTLVANKYLSDVKFIVNGATIPAHKALLITSSNLFYEVFEQKKENSFVISDVDNDIFMDVLKYCYTDKINITKQNVQKLLIAADKLKVKQIANICHGYIDKHLTPESIFYVFEQAKNCKNEAIEKKCLEYILKNEQKCFNSVSFFHVPLLNLKEILKFCNFPSEKQSEIVCRHLQGPVTFQQPIKNHQGNPNNPGNSQQPKQKNRNRSKSRNKPAVMSIPTQIFEGQSNDSMIAQFLADEKKNQNLPKLNPVRPFAEQPQTTQLINFDDDEIENIITYDDDDKSSGKLKVFIKGPRKKQRTQFSRLDFVCKKAMTIHKIILSEDLATKGCELLIKVCSYDHKNDVKDLHTRSFKTKSAMPLSFINLNRFPLTVFGGQKFFIKIKFSGSVEALHINANEITPNEFVELRKDSDVKNYFNCVSSLIVCAAEQNA